MIAHIEGKIIHIAPKFIIVDVTGLGYKIYTAFNTLASCVKNNQISLWVHTAVRENSIDLYGFEMLDELEFFELLLNNVSGVGPKSALGILSVATLSTLKKAIATGDTSYLNKVSGIGKKTAEKIVIELRDKLYAHKDEEGTPNSLRGESDIVEALKSLGYSQNDARDVLRQIPQATEGASARIKEALKILGER